MNMCTSDALQTNSMAKPIHKGFLQHFRKRFIGNNWRKEWVVLHEDSCLEWFKDEEESSLLGSILLKDSPEMIAAGPYANYVPGKPELPKNTDPNTLLVFGSKTSDVTAWFLASNTDELSQWMTSISNTLPPPPTGNQQNGQPQQPHKQNPLPSAPPPPYTEHPRPTVPPSQGIPSQRPAMAAPAGPQSTVIVDRRSDGMGNFASGMMMGAALGGWGYGYGWGLGPRIGIGYGGWGYGMGFGVGPMGYGGTNVTNITNNVTNTTNEQGTDAETGTAVSPEVDSPSAPENVEPENGIDPGLDSGVDPNGFQPGFEPDAEFIPGAGPGEGLGEMTTGFEGGGFDGGAFDAGAIDVGGLDIGGFDGGGFDGGGFDFGGFGGGFDMGGFDF